MFKLLRLWNLNLCEDNFKPRDIPAEQRDFGTHFTEDIKLVALFDPSVKYKLTETYGLDCYTETDAGLRFEIGFTKRDYLVGWLLTFGDKVKVLEPEYIAEDIKAVAKNILLRYK